MDKEKVRWAQIALMVFAVGLLAWVISGGSDGDGALNQISGLVAGVCLIAAIGLLFGAWRDRRRA